MGVTTVSNSSILGGWVTKVLRIAFLCYRPDKKCHFKKLHFGKFVLFVFVNFCNSYSNSLKALSPGQKYNLFRSFEWFKSVPLNFNQCASIH